MDDIIKGRAWAFGDNISTDEILPAHYMTIVDHKELAAHAMEGSRPDLAGSFRPGEILVAGENFGCGSSREHAQLALKGLGVGAIIAKSFARIFMRNSINTGLLTIECPGAVVDADEGDILQVNPQEGIVANITKGKRYYMPRLPDFLLDYLRAGGLIEYLLSEKATTEEKRGNSYES